VIDEATLYERLAGASSLETEFAAIRFRARYEPAAGPGSKLSPPTYPVEGDRQTPYLFEDRRVGEHDRRAVLLDSRQAQANRCEEALAEAVRDGRIWIPHIRLDVETHGRHILITSLTAPHRSRDAYFRDAADPDGTPFDETEAGAALAACTPEDATPLYRYAPTDLIYGVWDSHRGLRLAARFPRVYTSELVGWEPREGVRAAGRFDLITSGQQRVKLNGAEWEPDPAGSKKLSQLGLGSIPPTTRTERGAPVPGGVTVEAVERLGILSFPAIARIRLGGSNAQAKAGRALLAALAILGDRLAFGGPGLFLRSGCDLLKVSEEVAWVGFGGHTEAIEIDAPAAVALYAFARERAAEAGLALNEAPITLRPKPNLQRAIDAAFFAGIEEREGD
jgi:CRISPR-associated protein Csb1